MAVHWRTGDHAELIAVEAKLEFTARLVQQAANCKRFADRVWIAVPVDGDMATAAAAMRDANLRLFDHVVDLGIGILAFRPARGWSYEVQPIHWPRASNTSRFERDAFMERHRDTPEEARVLPPRNHAAYPRF